MIYAPWLYKRVLTDSNSTAVTAFQVRVALTADNFTFAHANSDGSDIRFWDATSGAALPYWIESWDAVAQTAVIWVKVADMTHTLEMYYGCRTATSESSLASTFEDSCDFETPFGLDDMQIDNAAEPLTTPTYDESGQMMHTSVVKFDTAWHGYLYWMVGTPYPASKETLENPSILASNDGETWVVPGGLTNPLDEPPVGGHLADPNLVYNPDTDELYCYYLKMDRGANLQSLMFTKSSDGVTWSTPAALNLTWALDGQVELSPSIVRKATGEWHYWAHDSVEASGIVHRTSADGLTWGAAGACTKTLAITPWHLNVQWVPSKNQYWMLCSNNAVPQNLYMMVSSDGEAWTWPSATPIIAAGSGTWDVQIYTGSHIYASTTDTLRIWYSAYNGTDTWHTGYVETDYSDLLQAHTSDDGGWTRTGSTISKWLRSAEQYKRGGHSGKQIGGKSPELKQTRKPAVLTDAYYEIDFYDPGPACVMWKCKPITGGSLMIGANDSISAAYYVTSGRTWSYTATTAPRSVGWHKFGTLVTSGSVAKMYVDDTLVKEATGQHAAIVSNEIGSLIVDSTTYWDDFRVRKYAATEPSIVVGTEVTMRRQRRSVRVYDENEEVTPWLGLTT